MSAGRWMSLKMSQSKLGLMRRRCRYFNARAKIFRGRRLFFLTDESDCFFRLGLKFTVKNPVQREGEDFERMAMKTFGGMIVNPILIVVNWYHGKRRVSGFIPLLIIRDTWRRKGEFWKTVTGFEMLVMPAESNLWVSGWPHSRKHISTLSRK